MESISGRVDDLIVYLLLFKAMVVERDRHWRRNQLRADRDHTI